MSDGAEKGPEPWLLKAATFTTFRPFSRPFNLKMASVAKGSSMLNTFEWVPLPQLTKICKEKDSIYKMGCFFPPTQKTRNAPNRDPYKEEFHSVQ